MTLSTRRTSTISLDEAGLKNPITKSPGFEKKRLSEWKIDLLLLCGFGCIYCSSNYGYLLRTRKGRLVEWLGVVEELIFSEHQIDYEPESFKQHLAVQLDRLGAGFGAGHTLVFSMLTDAFSPATLKSGLTRDVLEMLLERTQFRIRVLTKNCTVGYGDWLDLFARHRDRFVVGLSIGTLDDDWTSAMELYTTPPSLRVRAFQNLLANGVPAFGMLCPVFPGADRSDRLEALVDAFTPNHPLVEDFWAEPFNDRRNARQVVERLTAVHHPYAGECQRVLLGERPEWSRYATNMLLALQRKAQAEGWIGKLKYMLYESGVTPDDARRIESLDGVLLQSIDKAGHTKNPSFHRLTQPAP
jgi:DNA repair photolyase